MNFDRDKILENLRIRVEHSTTKRNPFLSILTRCYSRPNFLYVVKSSLACQTDKDFEHILLIDDIGQGIGGANCFFYKERNIVKGEYVFLLDDDNFIAYEDFIKDIKHIARRKSPDIIYFKKKQIIEYPTFKVWKKAPVEDHIDTSCFCVKKEVFLANIIHFCQPKKGDFHFIKHAHGPGKNPKAVWFNKITNLAYRISAGKKENEE